MFIVNSPCQSCGIDRINLRNGQGHLQTRDFPFRTAVNLGVVGQCDANAGGQSIWSARARFCLGLGPDR